MAGHLISERASAIRRANVYLAEARRRRGQSFHATLLQWAANCRRRAADARRPVSLQADLFAEES